MCLCERERLIEVKAEWNVSTAPCVWKNKYCFSLYSLLDSLRSQNKFSLNTLNQTAGNICRTKANDCISGCRKWKLFQIAFEMKVFTELIGRQAVRHIDEDSVRTHPHAPTSVTMAINLWACAHASKSVLHVNPELLLERDSDKTKSTLYVSSLFSLRLPTCFPSHSEKTLWLN